MKASTKEPFLELVQISSDIWNERKAIQYSASNQLPRQIKKLRKLLKTLQEIDFETELKSLEEIHQKTSEKSRFTPRKLK
jgi:hypothetical protein